MIHLVSKQKGRNSLATTILGFVPIVNFYLLVYFVGATSRLMELQLEEMSRGSATAGHEAGRT